MPHEKPMAFRPQRWLKELLERYMDTHDVDKTTALHELVKAGLEQRPRPNGEQPKPAQQPRRWDV